MVTISESLLPLKIEKVPVGSWTSLNPVIFPSSV